MTNLPATVTAGLSSRLRALCETPTEWRYGDAGGASAVNLPWTPPREVSEGLLTEAKIVAQAAEDALRPAGQDTIRKWLVALGTLCAGQMPEGDAKAKLAVYAPLLEYPPLCFTKGTLRDAAARFKWFPSYAELSEFLDETARPAREIRARLWKIAGSQVALPAPIIQPKPKRTPEEMAAIDAKNAAAIADLKAAADASRQSRSPVTKPLFLRDGPFDGLPGGQDPQGKIPDTWPLWQHAPRQSDAA